MNREDALAYVKKNGALPEQPPLDGRQCLHAESPQPCSCHLTIEQQGVAAELGNYTLFLFGLPHRGRVKVPYAPPAGAPRALTQTHVAPEAPEATNAPVAPAAIASAGVAQPLEVSLSAGELTTTLVAPRVGGRGHAERGRETPGPRKFDPAYNSAYAKARRRGPEAVAVFKAEWAAKKAAA